MTTPPVDPEIVYALDTAIEEAEALVGTGAYRESVDRLEETVAVAVRQHTALTRQISDATARVGRLEILVRGLRRRPNPFPERPNFDRSDR